MRRQDPSALLVVSSCTIQTLLLNIICLLPTGKNQLSAFSKALGGKSNDKWISKNSISRKTLVSTASERERALMRSTALWVFQRRSVWFFCGLAGRKELSRTHTSSMRVLQIHVSREDSLRSASNRCELSNSALFHKFGAETWLMNVSSARLTHTHTHTHTHTLTHSLTHSLTHTHTRTVLVLFN